MTILKALSNFHVNLQNYRAYRIIYKTKGLNKKDYQEMLSLREKLVGERGVLKDLIKELTGSEDEKLHIMGKGPEYSFNMWSVSLRERFDKVSQVALGFCIDSVNQALRRFEADIELGIRDKQGKKINESIQTNKELPKTFIAHGGETEARSKLQKYLIALGVQPLIIEEESFEDRSVNQQVEHYLNQADCSIILGTADDKELEDGKLYPRRNVYIEIGRFQEKFPNRIIYLLEEGASFPSDISEKLYTRFTQDNMEKAFLRIVIELKAFGILKAVKP